MTPRQRALVAAGGVLAAVAVGFSLRAIPWGREPHGARCGEGFAAVGARCCVAHGTGTLAGGVCPVHEVLADCPAPLVATPAGCDVPDARVHVPRADVLVGPSDWEAEGRVPPRLVTAGPFAIDAFEMTVGRYTCAHDGADPCASAFRAERAAGDAARAVSGIPARAAADACAARGGHLPAENEWIVAAAGATARRYPWGDTGAVCRRAAFGLGDGPCATGARGPDTAGAHGDGTSPLGIHDLAGNVAEWVRVTGASSPGPAYVARGGSWQSALATELRTWSRIEPSPGARDPRVGFRCAYDE